MQYVAAIRIPGGSNIIQVLGELGGGGKPGLTISFPHLPRRRKEAMAAVAEVVLAEKWGRAAEGDRDDIYVLDLDVMNSAFSLSLPWLAGQVIASIEFDIEDEELFGKPRRVGLARIILEPGALNVYPPTPGLNRFRLTPWAFVSSVGQGLKEFRAAARDACLRAHVLPVGMEHWTAEGEAPLHACLDHLSDCDLVLLVLGHRYGSIPAGQEKSFTELEFDKAVAVGKPVRAFALKSAAVDLDQVDAADLVRMQAFRGRIGRDQLRGEISSTADLELAVYQALAEWMKAAGAGS